LILTNSNPLISEKTNSCLDELSCRFFWMNKKIDRMKSVLTVNFVMPTFSNIVHLQLAHQYPLVADMVGEIQENFNTTPLYLTVDGAVENYSSVEEMFVKLYDLTIETNEAIIECMDIAKSEGNINVWKELSDVLQLYSKYISNAILLKDKAKQYGSNLALMDAEAESWWKL
jgi:hypothetical protein